ncbi:ribonuclease Z [Thermoleophilum album]|uniref:ribonuclease Z n=1 Tax=Thermoleophilum album TaxID=29539 RepID=UPI00237CD085|nr:ribonuclease Z [Thermoleophilum album]WDT92830.1 ribonuclease Z [Thermoleophilum album]
MELEILFLGTAGSVPTARRALPATLVRRGGHRLLIDCGEGTQRQLLRSEGLVEIPEILVTHLHADHVLGLPGLLKTWGLLERATPLVVRGPRGLASLLRALRSVVGRVPYEVVVEEIDPPAEFRYDGWRLGAFAVDHGVAALGYAIVEDERPGQFDPVRAQELGVAPGPDFGRLQRGETVTGSKGPVKPEQVMGPPRPGRKLVFSGDTRPCELLRAAAWRCDVLVHEATFAEEDRSRARKTRHSTAREAAELARECEARTLVLTHLSPRYPPKLLAEEAKAVFATTLVPRDFDRLEVPFPERGKPRLVEHSARPAPAGGNADFAPASSDLRAGSVGPQ